MMITMYFIAQKYNIHYYDKTTHARVTPIKLGLSWCIVNFATSHARYESYVSLSLDSITFPYFLVWEAFLAQREH